MSTIGSTAYASFQQLADIYKRNANAIAVQTAMIAGADTLLACAFTTVNPIGAAILGAVSGLSGPLWHWSLQQANIAPDSDIAKIAAFALKVFTYTLLGTFAAAAVGFSMPFGTALVLNLGGVMIATSGRMLIRNMSQ